MEDVVSSILVIVHRQPIHYRNVLYIPELLHMRKSDNGQIGSSGKFNGLDGAGCFFESSSKTAGLTVDTGKGS